MVVRAKKIEQTLLSLNASSLMIKSLCTLFFILFVGTISLPVFALSLGDINVKSHFAEPFLAEISIPSFTDEELASIQIHLASNKLHDDMGYIASEATRSFHFSVKEDIDGNFYIRVKSESSVKELSVSLLIEIISVSGRIIKGYDVLLTPSALIKKEKSSSPVKLIEPQSKAAVTKKSPPIKTTTKSVKKRIKFSKVKRLPNGGFEYLNVGSGETLSSIAKAIRPNKNINLNQVVAALHMQNPKAFLNNNINNLKMGANLKLSNIESILKLSQFDAYEYIQQQSRSGNRKKISNVRKSKRVEKIVNLVTKREFLTAEVKDEKSIKEIQNIKAELGLAHKITKELENKNENLVGMISKLEVEIKKMTKSLIQDPDDILPKTIIKDPLIVRSSNIQQKNKPTFLDKNLTPILIFGIGILVISIVFAKKKESIKSYFENNKAKKDQNIFD